MYSMLLPHADRSELALHAASRTTFTIALGSTRLQVLVGDAAEPDDDQTTPLSPALLTASAISGRSNRARGRSRNLALPAALRLFYVPSPRRARIAALQAHRRRRSLRPDAASARLRRPQ